MDGLKMFLLLFAILFFLIIVCPYLLMIVWNWILPPDFYIGIEKAFTIWLLLILWKGTKMETS